MNLSGFELFKRKLIKRLLSSFMYLIQAVLILFGKQNPVMRFKVENDPPSVYLNFRIRPDQLQALENQLDLPPGFSLAKLRYLEDDHEAYHCITMNAYRVSGPSSGRRIEWSTYIKDPQGKIRYMVVEARATTKSLDSVNLMTPSYYLKHSNKEGVIETLTRTDDGRNFSARFTTPNGETTPTAYASREWVMANDEIYWLNGVFDRVFYNRHFACAKMYVVAPDSVTIEDSTRWAPYIEPTPRLVAVFEEGIEFLVGPWWNV